MKAIIYEKYGSPDVLTLKEVSKPVPQADEVLVKVLAVGINSADLHLLKADPFLVRLMAGGLLKPKYQILGADIAGIVETVGANVTKFKPGDEVFGDNAANGWGGLAEYVAVKESALVSKPTNLSFIEAAAVPMAAVTALHALRDKGQIKAGQKVLINGASGGVGTFAIQLAKYFGAEVTAVCSSRNIDLARSLGADFVIDYSREDFTKNGKQYDLILGVNGYHSLTDYQRALNPTGKYVMSGGAGKQMFQAMFLGPLMSHKGGKQIIGLSSQPVTTDLTFISKLLQQGKIHPVIAKTYSLAEAAEAFRYVEAGHAQGKVVISVTNN